MKASIFDIERFAIHDGPGIRTTVFFQGCMLRCPWCANPESQEVGKHLMYNKKKCMHCLQCVKNCPMSAMKASDDGIWIERTVCKGCRSCESVCLNEAIKFSGQEMDTEDILRTILRDKDYYDATGGGITLSGGEALLQWQAAKTILMQAKDSGVHTAIETCGQVPNRNLQQVFPYTDLFLFDIKHPDPDKFAKVTGGNLKQILENLAWLVERNPAAVILRVPVIPDFNFNEKDLRDIFSLAVEFHIQEVHLLPYHTLGIHKYEQLGREYYLKEQRGIRKEELTAFQRIGETMGLQVLIGG